MTSTPVQCQHKHPGHAVPGPVQSCALTRYVLAPAAPVPDPEPVQLSVVTRYVIVETVPVCGVHFTQSTDPLPWYTGGVHRAPEIDSGNAVSAFLILGMGLAVILGKRS